MVVWSSLLPFLSLGGDDINSVPPGDTFDETPGVKHCRLDVIRHSIRRHSFLYLGHS